ncbi:unnamed protein product [Laminaria digitata]
MFVFYNLRMEVEPGEEANIVKGANFKANYKWLEPSNHNALRLTRIIASLRHFRLELYANALQVFQLCNLPELDGHPSKGYWWAA